MSQNRHERRAANRLRALGNANGRRPGVIQTDAQGREIQQKIDPIDAATLFCSEVARLPVDYEAEAVKIRAWMEEMSAEDAGFTMSETQQQKHDAVMLCAGFQRDAKAWFAGATAKESDPGRFEDREPERNPQDE